MSYQKTPGGYSACGAKRFTPTGLVVPVDSLACKRCSDSGKPSIHPLESYSVKADGKRHSYCSACRAAEQVIQRKKREALKRQAAEASLSPSEVKAVKVAALLRTIDTASAGIAALMS